MKIADFLEVAREEILAESVAYARTIPCLKHADEKVIRDHLPKVFEAISADLRTSQSRRESIAKSQGLADETDADEETAAESHGLLRARSGLHIEQVFAEYRALRSCVLRLWAEASPPEPDALQDAARFNEAIDQALAESVRVYAAEVERWQQLFLGVLGHDLRGPLNAIVLTAEIISRVAPDTLTRPTTTLKQSAMRMASLLDTLLEFNKIGLGNGMSIERAPTDLEAECRAEVALQRTALPGARIELHATGDTWGTFDGSRVREALGNLVSNAVKHGLAEPVIVRLDGNAQNVRIEVENKAAREIPADELAQLFEPLRRGALQQPDADRSHLGLGLFIVKQIANLHEGEVTGHSSADKVRFVLTLPKSPAVSAR